MSGKGNKVLYLALVVASLSLVLSGKVDTVQYSVQYSVLYSVQYTVQTVGLELKKQIQNCGQTWFKIKDDLADFFVPSFFDWIEVQVNLSCRNSSSSLLHNMILLRNGFRGIFPCIKVVQTI